MFSTKLVENRYYIPCIVLTDVPIVHSFIVDTGAKYTCCSYKTIDFTLNEDSFADADVKILGGIVSGAEIRFYKFHAAQFTVGNISMGERDIWITFDDRVKDNVLGMDILQSISFMQYADSKELHFFTDSNELQTFILEAAGNH